MIPSRILRLSLSFLTNLRLAFRRSVRVAGCAESCLGRPRPAPRRSRRPAVPCAGQAPGPASPPSVGPRTVSRLRASGAAGPGVMRCRAPSNKYKRFPERRAPRADAESARNTSHHGRVTHRHFRVYTVYLHFNFDSGGVAAAVA